MKHYTNKVSQSDIDLFVDRFVREFFPTSKSVIFFGSRSRGEETEESDYDLLVLVDRVEFPYRQHVYIGGWLFDICVFDEASALSACEVERSARLDYYRSTIITGRILRDEQGKLRALREALLSKGLLPDASPSLKFYRLSLSCLIRDIRGKRNEQEYVTSCVELHQCLLRCCHMKHFGTQGMPVYLTKRFLKVDPSFAQEMHQSLIEAIDGNAAKMLALAESVLDSIGGPAADRECFRLA